jgi:hypothetical protein
MRIVLRCGLCGTVRRAGGIYEWGLPSAFHLSFDNGAVALPGLLISVQRHIVALQRRSCMMTQAHARHLQLSISIFSVVYFSIDVARGEQTIANTPSERPKTKFPLFMRLPDPADGDIHY